MSSRYLRFQNFLRLILKRHVSMSASLTVCSVEVLKRWEDNIHPCLTPFPKSQDFLEEFHLIFLPSGLCRGI